MPKNGGIMPVIGTKSDAFAAEKRKKAAKKSVEDRLCANEAELDLLEKKVMRHLPADKRRRIISRIMDLKGVVKRQKNEVDEISAISKGAAPSMDVEAIQVS